MPRKPRRRLSAKEKLVRDLRDLCLACAVALFSCIATVRGVFPPLSAWQAWYEEGVSTEGSAPGRGSTVGDRLLSDEEAAERERFVSIWAPRIDAFNEGYPLEGYGRTFAEAAYDYNIDPRFSPAIARVESGSGENCYRDYNAWGWGGIDWPDWDTAIREHAKGLSEGYGYTLTYATAVSYNQVNIDEWYQLVASCMYQIWETDSL